MRGVNYGGLLKWCDNQLARNENVWVLSAPCDLGIVIQFFRLKVQIRQWIYSNLEPLTSTWHAKSKWTSTLLCIRCPPNNGPWAERQDAEYHGYVKSGQPNNFYNAGKLTFINLTHISHNIEMCLLIIKNSGYLILTLLFGCSASKHLNGEEWYFYT